MTAFNHYPSSITRPLSARPISARGFSLLEVMIALVILSVGLLGLAALQAEGLRGSSAAFQRSQAIALVSDVADRMRANRGGLTGYVIALAASPPAETSITRCADTTAGAPADCTPAQMAQYDVVQWFQSFNSFYDASIQPAVAGATTAFTISVQWTDRTTANQPTSSYQATIQF